MNKKEVELTKYFDNMCIIFNTKKVMFSEWEKYFKKLKETIISGITDIDYPKSQEEQGKIGAYFKSLDEMITLHQHKCDELQKLKKFMLQNMFM